MDYLEKTRDELIEDLETLRRRLASLEIEMIDGELDLGPVLNPSRRAAERAYLGANAEVSPCFERIEATGVNSSSGGVCFEIEGPLRFKLRILQDGHESVREAVLVWANRAGSETSRLGFRFVS